LIELLVVIAIIAILAAILFPVFAQAREKARQTSCLSNCKQMGTATQLYIDDYDETLPPPAIADANADLTNTSYPWYYTKNKCNSPYDSVSMDYMLAWSNWTWRDSIFPYVKNVQLYYCPSYKNTPNYGMNCWLSYDEANNARTLSLAQIKNTSELVLYTKTQHDSVYCRTNSFPIIMWIEGSGCGPDHNGGDNITYVDGHAKYCKKGVDAFANAAGWGPFDRWWNPDYQ
ncbi:MAG: DUF1559 domain-containing protein, partial [Armatimonadetes bacterium]|nr:DUF1559 domain-containing protein [Candidatus Hippobium faecium]